RRILPCTDIQGIYTHHISLAIASDDHAHLGDPDELVIEIYSEEILIRVLIHFGVRQAICLFNAEQRMNKEPARSARRVDNTLTILWFKHVHSHLHYWPWCEILAFLTLLLWINEVFKSRIHNLKVRMSKRNWLQSRHAEPERIVLELDSITLIEEVPSVR